MTLREMRKPILRYVAEMGTYTEYNKEILEIFNGNLKTKVDKLMAASLGEAYYSKIKNRLLPINVWKRIIQKESKAYVNRVNRIVPPKYDKHMAYYEDKFDINTTMGMAEEFSNMHKGYSLEPYLYEGVPQLRVIPYDRFLPYTMDTTNPTKMKVWIKFMGTQVVSKTNGGEEARSVYYTFSNDEFDAFDSEGETYLPAFEENPDGINPFETIPAIYSNRSMLSLVPTQDSDSLQLSLMIPAMLSDVAGALFFQSFSILWGLDIMIAEDGLKMSPNAFWNLKSDPATKKEPKIGQIKPEVDTEKYMSMIRDTLTAWLDTRGIRVGNIGSADGASSASGIAKIIDEMDSFEARKSSIIGMKNDEERLWDLVKIMHNHWLETEPDADDLRQLGPIGDDWEVIVDFDEPRPKVTRLEEIEVIVLERESKLLDQRSAIEMAYPDLTPKEVDLRMALVESESEVKVSFDEQPGGDDGEMAESENTNSKGP